MSNPHFPTDSLTHFVQCLQQVPDPRSKHGTSHSFRTILALVFLGLLGNITTLAEIERWSKLHFPQLKKFLRFKRNKGKYIVPHAITFARILRKLSLDDLQHAFAEFLNGMVWSKTNDGSKKIGLK